MHKIRSILITGASRGIGQQLALQYAAPNVHLILVARDADRLQETAERCQALGASTIYEPIDICNAEAIKAFVELMDQQMPIDLVIANAGVSSTLQPNWQPETKENIDRAFAVNVQGTLNTVNPLIERMIARNSGQIVLMSSMAGLRGLPQSPSYSASKAALLMYGQSLRGWLARYHIKVNVVCPGYIKTDMSDRLVGPKPFLMSREKAASTIQRGLMKNKPCIAFPWPLRVLTQLAYILPARPVNAILNCFESYAIQEEAVGREGGM